MILDLLNINVQKISPPGMRCSIPKLRRSVGRRKVTHAATGENPGNLPQTLKHFEWHNQAGNRPFQNTLTINVNNAPTGPLYDANLGRPIRRLWPWLRVPPRPPCPLISRTVQPVPGRGLCGQPPNLRAARGPCPQHAWSDMTGTLRLRSGNPFTVVMSSDIGRSAVPTAGCAAHDLPSFNTAAFLAPRQYTFANEKHDIVIGEPVSNSDPIVEHKRLQLRAELFKRIKPYAIRAAGRH